ncbi:MAG: acetylornithine deacetylase [Rhodospirillaceae bacterium]|jgi:acetylornithine deacetylase|nr:acetylornithine deacetylase [Rhodospirillaceae bacterium]|tara:strand:- start:847 stop:2004 length:1158 start_codon:yes stop_codon:yes gene_type:complete
MAQPQSLDFIKKLVAFDTTSRESNLELIAFIQDTLSGLGVDSTLVHNQEGTKANLYATLGDRDKPGIMLSGHTDVVPVDGQAWDTDPFQAAEKDGKLWGRGTADMKSFIAIVLALAPEFLERGLKTPIHLAFSYDEEVGCIGVRRLIDKLKDMPVKPAMCIVGEPTSMQVVTGHKGKRSYAANVRGLEAHSALAPQGVNAIEYAAELIAHLKGMARRIEAEGPYDELYEVTHSTVHTGVISGGVQLNIVPKACRFEFELRTLAIDDPKALEREIRDFVADTLEPRMHAVSPEAGIDIECFNDMPGLETDPGEDVVTFVKALAGRNDHAKVAFGTEAGLFQTRADIPTVVCGPGDIAQAHKANEFITLEQIAKGEDFMRRLMDEVC